MTSNPTQTSQQENNESLRQLGWCDHFEHMIAEHAIDPARVARVLSAQRNQFLVSNGQDEWACTAAGRLLRREGNDYPVTGDWVVSAQNVIEQVLPRKNTFSRGEAGSNTRRAEAATGCQPIGTNIDTVFIVCGLDRDYNLRRIERYLALVYNCGITPAIILTKADLHDSPDECKQEVEDIAFGVPVILSSLASEDSLAELGTYLRPGRTAAMIGSSGAGKSTLANRLYGGDIQSTSEISTSVGKGRHTTTTRELIRMPQGGMLMDNPGIREVALSANGGGIEATFPDIEELAGMCRFSDCSHKHEPGCAVLEAVENGDLDHKRLASYHKMKREMGHATSRRERGADRVEKERWRDVAMEIKRIKKRK